MSQTQVHRRYVKHKTKSVGVQGNGHVALARPRDWTSALQLSCEFACYINILRFQSLLRLCQTQGATEQQFRFGDIVAQCWRHIVDGRSSPREWQRPSPADGHRSPVAGFRFRSTHHHNTIEETEQGEWRLRHVRRPKRLV